MLNSDQLADYCNRHHLSPMARQVIALVRSSQPTRRVRSGTHNVSCRYASRKMGMVIQAESHQTELPAVVAWDHDDTTYEFYDQPPKIKLSYIGKTGKRAAHMATPDFFLLQEGFTGWVECKTEEWLQAAAAKNSTIYVPDGAGGWRCPPAEDYAVSVGLGFRVRSSAVTCWTTVRNLEFLADYLDERCPPADPAAVLRIREALGDRPWVALKALLEDLPVSDADALFKMVADESLHVRLDKDLLTEPERAMVFRDRLARDAYQSHLDSQAVPTMPALRTVTVAPGQSLLWNGKPWRILNVGDTDVFLEDVERVISSLQRPAFEKLVRDGVIAGLPAGTTLDHDGAEEAVRTASPTDFESAQYRYLCLFPDRAEGKCLASSDRARRKWRALFRRGVELFGSGFLGLLPRIHQRGNRNRRLDEQVIKIMNEVIDENYAQPGARTQATCWGEVRLRCQEAGLLAPSEAAFRDEVRRRRGHELTVAREGEKAAYAASEFYWHVDRATPRHGERPFEIGHIDHTTLDLHFVGSRKGEKLGKAWLSVLLDANSRMVLAWVVLFDAPSYRSCMALIRECIRLHGRAPKYVVVDRGPEFESIYFETLLARLDCHKKTRPGSKPRFGSVIERFFGMSNEAFVHNLRGNNQALQKPRQMSKTHDPRELAVWTLAAFDDAFKGFIEQVYGAMEHPALGMSPKEAMTVGLAQSGMRRHVLIPYTRDLTIMCLPSTRKGTASVDPGRGVKIGYVYYWTPAFRSPALAHKPVSVRYDPYDLSVAFAWLKDHWAPCQSEYASDFQEHSEKEIAIATQELRARAKRTGKRRAINAALIAEYLRSTTVTEKTLEQRLRDLETHPRHEQHATPKPEVIPPSSDLDALEDGIWKNLDAHIFGELK